MEKPELPAPLRAEIGRFFTSVEQHASASGNCYDGHGYHATVAITRAAEAKSKAGKRVVVVAYTFRLREEADTRGCSRGPEGCHLLDESTRQEVSLTFQKSGNGWRLEVPEMVPGMDAARGAGPLTRPFHGDCYGDHPAFESSVVAEGRGHSGDTRAVARAPV